ncbi:hypothetical protein [Pseudomonas sp. MWU12-2323]|uniref:hypothetical protein n=1 Tax=Pseudomonas sp. MWU12-2323 TaxID=2651296 RepID=UPI00128BEAC2|nr:hypothetical protein [Pseudomonas sp. MWU12-2323]MPQ69446.1 hypothetical protein [Pseudomonas sp. MWU12-2323]
MSAKQAAQALIDHDPHVSVKVLEIQEMGHYHPDRRDAVMELLREIMGTWTLTLAAQAANTSEQSVIAALASHEPLRIGTAVVARGIAAELYEPR